MIAIAPEREYNAIVDAKPFRDVPSYNKSRSRPEMESKKKTSGQGGKEFTLRFRFWQQTELNTAK